MMLFSADLVLRRGDGAAIETARSNTSKLAAAPAVLLLCVVLSLMCVVMDLDNMPLL